MGQNFLKVPHEVFSSVGEIMVPFKGRNYLHQPLLNKPHKWDFKILGYRGFSLFIYDFDVYQGCSNKSNSSFGVSGNVVVNLCSTLSKQENHKVFADNFTSLPLIEHLKSDGIWYTGTICGTIKKLPSVN